MSVGLSERFIFELMKATNNGESNVLHDCYVVCDIILGCVVKMIPIWLSSSEVNLDQLIC